MSVSPAPEPRQQRSQRRKAQILAAAERIMVEEGMKDVTHRAVAARAQVPAASIRYYFNARGDLLAACIRSILQRRSDAATQAAHLARCNGPHDEHAAADLLLQAYFGPELDDDSLTGAVGWMADTTRETESLHDLLRETRAAIDTDLELIAQLCGVTVDPAIIGAVLDGAILTGAIEGRENLRSHAATLLATVVTMAGGTGPA